MNYQANNSQAASDTVHGLVRLNQILDRLERVADILPAAFDVPKIDEAQRIIMDILVAEGRREVALNGMWRKPNTSATFGAGEQKPGQLAPGAP